MGQPVPRVRISPSPPFFFCKKRRQKNFSDSVPTITKAKQIFRLLVFYCDIHCLICAKNIAVEITISDFKQKTPLMGVFCLNIYTLTVQVRRRKKPSIYKRTDKIVLYWCVCVYKIHKILYLKH